MKTSLSKNNFFFITEKKNLKTNRQWDDFEPFYRIYDPMTIKDRIQRG